MIAIFRSLAFLSLPGLILAGALAACSAAQDFEPGETGRVAGIEPPLTLSVETETGALAVRLAELDAPDPVRAAAALETLALDHTVRLAYGGARRDRYERALAQVYVDAEAGEIWLQEALVSAGAARVMPYPDNHAAAVSLYVLEREARAEGLGLWADSEYGVRDTHPDGLAQHYASVQIVEGRVLQTAQTRSGRIYLNFGADYRTDFTVLVEPEAQPAFAELDLLALEGQRVRVRGWLSEENGPMIRLEHPARLERLED